VSAYCTPWPIRYHGPGTAADGGTVKRWRIGLPGLLISLLATGVLLTQLDLAQLAAALRNARYGWLAPAFLLLLPAQLARALPWPALLADRPALAPAPLRPANISPSARVRSAPGGAAPALSSASRIGGFRRNDEGLPQAGAAPRIDRRLTLDAPPPLEGRPA